LAVAFAAAYMQSKLFPLQNYEAQRDCRECLLPNILTQKAATPYG
jgi:hypothetical protein